MNRVFSLALAVIVGGIFICAGVLKITDSIAFYHDIVLYHLVDDEFSWRLAHYLPWLEVIAGGTMIFRWSRPSAALILATLLLVFMGAVLSAWYRGLNIECGCFGRLSGASSYSWVLIRDICLLSAVLYLGVSSSLETRARRL